MKGFIRAAAAAAALTGVAQLAGAADLAQRPPPPPPVVKAPPYVAFSWTGFYAGVNGGYGFGTSKWAGVPASFDAKGGLAGGQLGYNLQVGQFVWGLEADGDWSGVRGSDAALLCNGAPCSVRTDFLATARGRVGIALDRVMPYLTGGLAVGDIRSGATGQSGVTSTNAGWTGGGGIEYALAPNWSVKTEYLFVDLGKQNCTGACALPMGTSVGVTESVARAGINYRF